jgi:prolyl-tRNA synthetase
MAHSDDDGLVLPPNLAPIQVVIVPIYKSEEGLQKIDAKVAEIKQSLQKQGISVKYDNRDTQRPGFKFAEWELKGVPVRIAIGERDLENNVAEVARRDTKTKQSIGLDGLTEEIVKLLADIHTNIYQKALAFRNEHITEVKTYEEFKEVLENKGGFVKAHWDGTSETEEKIKEETKATIRCIPLDTEKVAGNCIVTGKPSAQQVLFARAY